MEALHSKWKHLHESSKSKPQSPPPPIHRFRSSSKDCLLLEQSQKSVSGIGHLLPSASLARVKSSRQIQPIEYYEVARGEGEEAKMDANAVRR
jgi:hypothetical protein